MTQDCVSALRNVQFRCSESGNSVKMQLEGVAEALISAAEGRNTVTTAMKVMNTTNDQQVVEELHCSKVAKRRNPEFRK